MPNAPKLWTAAAVAVGLVAGLAVGMNVGTEWLGPPKAAAGPAATAAGGTVTLKGPASLVFNYSDTIPSSKKHVNRRLLKVTIETPDPAGNPFTGATAFVLTHKLSDGRVVNYTKKSSRLHGPTGAPGKFKRMTIHVSTNEVFRAVSPDDQRLGGSGTLVITTTTPTGTTAPTGTDPIPVDEDPEEDPCDDC